MSEAFWNFSIAVYRSDAVQAECLDLQDRFGLDVNLVLFCAFVGAAHGIILASTDISAARELVDRWHEDIVRTLRSLRRGLKTIELPDTPSMEAAKQLRASMKAAELESERIEQTMLSHWAEARLMSRPRSESTEAVSRNLQTLLAAYGIGPARLTAAHCMKHMIAASLSAAAA